MEAAYFVPDRLMIRELIGARRRGVRIRHLVPFTHLDAKVVGIASKSEWGPLLEHGVEIYVYRPTMLHCKLLLFDGYMCSARYTLEDWQGRSWRERFAEIVVYPLQSQL